MLSDREKRFIVEKRALGATFVEIGRQLNRSEDSVRSAFNRLTGSSGKNHNVVAEGEKNVAYCKHCGKSFDKPRGSKRLFCSESCRYAFSTATKRSIPYNRVCEYCGKNFVSFGNPDRRFCSRRCFAASQKEAQNGEKQGA